MSIKAGARQIVVDDDGLRRPSWEDGFSADA